MVRPVFRTMGAAKKAAPRIVHLDLDRPLVEAARQDPARFEALYRRYLAPVYSFAYYELGNHHAAVLRTTTSDAGATWGAPRRVILHPGSVPVVRGLGAVPEGLAVLLEERAQPEDGAGASTFKVWLFRIARNVISNERRTARRHPAALLDSTTAAIIADPLNVEGETVRRDEASQAWRAVGRLPGDRRRALVLRFVDEMSTAEIAGVMGRSEGAVRVLLHRALRTVARDLGGRR